MKLINTITALSLLGIGSLFAQDRETNAFEQSLRAPTSVVMSYPVNDNYLLNLYHGYREGTKPIYRVICLPDELQNQSYGIQLMIPKLQGRDFFNFLNFISIQYNTMLQNTVLESYRSLKDNTLPGTFNMYMKEDFIIWASYFVHSKLEKEKKYFMNTFFVTSSGYYFKFTANGDVFLTRAA